MTEMTRRGFLGGGAAAAMGLASTPVSAQATTRDVINTIDAISSEFAGRLGSFYEREAGEYTKVLIQRKRVSHHYTPEEQNYNSLIWGIVDRAEHDIIPSLRSNNLEEALLKYKAVHCAIKDTADVIREQRDTMNSTAAWKSANRELQDMELMAADLRRAAQTNPGRYSCAVSYSNIISRSLR